MRTFVADILCPPPGSPIRAHHPTSSDAIAAILLDDAGLDPDDLVHGLTVIEVEHTAIAGAIVALVKDAVLPLESTTEHYERLVDDEVLVVSSQVKAYVSAAVDKALELDAPLVVAVARATLPLEILLQTDRHKVLPDRLTTDQIVRAVALVCIPEPDKILDFTGVADWVKLDDAIKSIRKGYLAGAVAARLRKIAEHRRAATEPPPALVAPAFIVGLVEEVD
jgi:hypothetical protein